MTGDPLVKWAVVEVSEMDEGDLREYAVALKKTMNSPLLRYRLLQKRLIEVEQELEGR